MRFIREIDLLRAFSHPNIVRYIEGSDRPPCRYLVMQYVRGKTLADYILNSGPLPVGESVELASDMLSALAYMHHRPEGVCIHRDVKPENILLDLRETSGPHLYVTDFGLSKTVASKLTTLRDHMGSDVYSPPEQLDAPSTVTPAADVHAAGMVLYYMLTGLHPYPLPSPWELRELARRGSRQPDEILSDLLKERKLPESYRDANLHCMSSADFRPVPVRKRAGGVPAGLGAVVDKAVSKRPDERFPGALQMLKALQSEFRKEA